MSKSPRKVVSSSAGIAPEEIKDLNFKVPVTFHQRFKMRAVSDGVSMNELLRLAFETYEKAQK
jgi:hypothetical protein